MSSRNLARRLLAFRDGRALPCGSTLHVPIAQPANVLMLAFVRMGGESSPWAVGYERPGGSRVVLTVPEPRNRTLVAQMTAQFSNVLVEHVRNATRGADVQSVQQVWVPNDSHVEMLHFLAYRYTFARRGDSAIMPALNQLGRAANALFQEAQRPGQTVLMAATAVLREAFEFPAEDLRQQHLGFLLPCLESTGDRASRDALASQAERLSMSTSLDPQVEESELQSSVEVWNRLEREGGSDADRRRVRADVQRVLTLELARRLDAVEAAIRHLRADPRRLNTGVPELVQATAARLLDGLPVIERGAHEADGRQFYVNSPDTDRNAQLAAARFFDLEEAHDAWVSVLIHDDAEMQADAIADGDALTGIVEAVRDVMRGRKHETTWVVASTSDGPLRLREGSLVCIAGCKKREARIRSIAARQAGGRVFELEIVKGKLACEGTTRVWAPAHEAVHIGSVVTFVATYPSEIHRRKRVTLWRRNKPGDWVHRIGRPALVPTADEPDE